MHIPQEKVLQDGVSNWNFTSIKAWYIIWLLGIILHLNQYLYFLALDKEGHVQKEYLFT